MLLELKDVSISYGTAMAVKDVNIHVEEKSVVSIIGANGAGKSTILKGITGLVHLKSGEIWFQGQKISGLPTHKIVARGVVHVPEGKTPFPYMSVMANLKLGAFLRKDKDGIKKDFESVMQIFPRLKDRLKQKAGTLSGGEQKMLAIGRGLMGNPTILMLDEPSLGLSPIMIEGIAVAIKTINSKGISVLLVEQNAGLVLSVAERGYVIEVGSVVLEGNIRELMSNRLVQKAFLGED